MDHAAAPGPSHEERCDYVYFDDDAHGRVAALELKRGSVRASKIAAQLRAGAEVAERLVRDHRAVRFVPVAAHGGHTHRQQINSLAKSENQVNFRGTRYRIVLLKCGASLAHAFRTRDKA